MSSAKDTDGDASSTSESPGRMMARAREAATINAADLAARLRLDTRIVKALERDDFENLPEPMFVKGYIRSIAKELGIDAGAILSAYELHTSVEPPTLADFSSRAPDQVGINSTSIKAVTYGLVALLVILIALWWRSNYRADESAVRAEAAAELLADSAVPLPYAFEVVEHDNATWRGPEPPEPVVASPNEATAPDDTGGNEVEPPVLATAQHSLSVTTDSEAWVEIYDRDGERLFFGMARAGRTVELSGQSYYRLILGNTDSLSLTFDDEPVDIAPYSREGVAQFELGSIEESGAPSL